MRKYENYCICFQDRKELMKFGLPKFDKMVVGMYCKYLYWFHICMVAYKHSLDSLAGSIDYCCLFEEDNKVELCFQNFFLGNYQQNED